MKITATRIAAVLAVLLLAIFLSPVARAAPAAGSADSSGMMTFESLRFGLHAEPPAVCAPALYGTITARAPDGALCLCRRGSDGQPGFWELLSTMQRCWPDSK
jgi:hypothetical protein